MDIILFILGVFFTWFFSYLYYKKSLKQQANEASSQISELLNLQKQNTEMNRQMIIQKRIEESIEEYRRAGTPVGVIDTYNDMSDEEKADLLDTVLLRAKGRKAKHNKYRISQQ